MKIKEDTPDECQNDTVVDSTSQIDVRTTCASLEIISSASVLTILLPSSAAEATSVLLVVTIKIRARSMKLLIPAMREDEEQEVVIMMISLISKCYDGDSPVVYSISLCTGTVLDCGRYPGTIFYI